MLYNKNKQVEIAYCLHATNNIYALFHHVHKHTMYTTGHTSGNL